MCTVTYIPHQKGYFLTSNRDEKKARGRALMPTEYLIGNNKYIFPKDTDAGGTWIVLKENGDSLCLLNGAFSNFIDNGMYTISRGKILLEIASNVHLLEAFKNMELNQCAPFTLIMVNQSKLFECRWDGEKKHCKMLDEHKPYIWSSATLYQAIIRSQREKWFESFLKNTALPSQDEIIQFHKTTGDGDKANDLVMNRNNRYFTVSITNITTTENEYCMHYEDLIQKEITIKSFSFVNA